MDTTDSRGRLVRKAVIYSNDPSKPEFKISITCFVDPVISIKPDRIFFNGFPDQKFEQKIIISANRAEPLLLTIEPNVLSSQISCSLDKINKTNSYLLTVQNKISESGVYRGRLIIKTNYKDKPVIAVPVFARLLADLQIIPKAVDFGRIDKNRYIAKKNSGPDKIRFPERYITLKLNRSIDFKITNIEITKDIFKITYNKLKKEKGYRLKLTPILNTMGKGIIKTVLKIDTTHKKYKLIEIPLQINII